MDNELNDNMVEMPSVMYHKLIFVTYVDWRKRLNGMIIGSRFEILIGQSTYHSVIIFSCMALTKSSLRNLVAVIQAAIARNALSDLEIIAQDVRGKCFLGIGT
jgi:hypothetical protein